MRVTRLGYFDDVNIETPPVPGTPDQVDVEVTVTEKATGNLLAGVGYSSADGVVLTGSISQQNIFGTGNALSLGDQHAARSTARISAHVTPSRTGPVDGVSRTLEVYDKNVDPTSLADRAVRVVRRSARAVGFGVPITETDTINFGGRVEHTKLTLFEQQPAGRTIEFVSEFGYVDQQLHR